jgi:hypothetical protein
MQTDSRLRELPKLSQPLPLACSGPGHDTHGYPCFNRSDSQCLGFVCRTCAARQKTKAYLELCNLCQLATERSCSMEKALAVVRDLHPQAVKRGKATCAATDKSAKPCRRCVRHECKRCSDAFRTHCKRGDYCERCRDIATREANRLRQERRRQKLLAEAA